MCEMLMGGWDVTTKTTYLASIDYLGNFNEKAPFYFRGIAGKFCLSILDRIYTPTMTEAQAIDAVKTCADEVQRRFVANIAGGKMNVWIVDKNGIRKIDY